MTTRIIPFMLVAVVLVLAPACAKKSDWIEQTLVTVDVTGTWERVGGGQPISFVLKQQGPKVSGFFKSEGYNQIGAWKPTDGTVAGDVFSFRVRDGFLMGDMTVTGEEMSGHVQSFVAGGGSQKFVLTLQRRNSSSSLPSPQP